MKKVILVIVLFLLIGCNKIPESQEAIESIMTTVKSGDVSKISELGIFSDENIKNKNFYVEDFKMINYEVLETTKENEKSIIKLSVKAPDLYYYTPEIYEKLLSLSSLGSTDEEIQEFLNKNFLEILKKQDLRYAEEEFNITLIKQEGKWILDKENSENKKFISVLLGGLEKMKDINEVKDRKAGVKFFKKGERGVISSTAQTLKEVKKIEKSQDPEIKDGNEIIVIKIKRESIVQGIIAGINKEQYQLETKDRKLISPIKDNKYGPFNTGYLYPNKSVEQTIAYEVPMGQSKNIVIIEDGKKIVSFDLEF